MLATRLPLAPGQLLTFDDVNLAYSIGHFDVRVSQPQPPGYPLFVMEMRALYWLRFRRAERILEVLALAASIAALVLLARFGNRMMGGQAGFCAACLLLFHPAFWQTGVTSALRMHLAVISVAVAAACWRAWQGEVRWVVWSAIILAVGAGIRPETGPLLFPLWAVAALLSPTSWKVRGQALAAMAGVVLLWLAPTVIASGGPVSYVRTNLEYVSEQAAMTSELFGATQAKAQATLWRLITWTGFGILGYTMPAVLAWRRKQGWAIDRGWIAFLALWFVPPMVFALSVHVEDPGQTLAMLPPVTLLGGYLVSRALDNLEREVSRWHTLTTWLATVAVAWIAASLQGWLVVLWVFLASLSAALLLKLGQTKNAGYPPRFAMLVILLAAASVLNVMAFNFHGWYYRGQSAAGWRASLEKSLEYMSAALELTSREAVERTLSTDDHALRQIRSLAAARAGQTVVVFEEGMTTWRKAAYYLPDVPVVVLEHKLIRSSPPTVGVWKGSRQESFSHGAPPLRVAVPAGSRIVWLLNPRTEFYALVQQAFAPASADPVYFTDLPAQSGSRVLGEYELAW